MVKQRTLTRHELELRELHTFARIYIRDRGPYVNLITGREPHPVGRIVCIKAGMQAIAWESMRAEKPMIELCEIASPIHKLKAQPHNLVMKVVAERRPWGYRPDLELEVDRRFADEVAAGKPFAKAVADWRPTKAPADTVPMIVEVKDDDDPRIADEKYLLKIYLARKVYEKIGWRFAYVVRTRDIDAPRIARAVRSMMLDHDASIKPRDIDVMGELTGKGERLTDLRSAIEALGGGAVARAKVAALHVRRIVWVDLTQNLSPDSPVQLIQDGRRIFELPGSHPW